MPRPIYRHHSPDSPRPSTSDTQPPTPIDADDTIVLSDLVRTGEASRLRRRGAMRIDHNANGVSAVPVQPLETIDWGYGDLDQDEDIDAGLDWPERELFADDAASAPGQEYLLCCGVQEDQEDHWDWESGEPLQPDPLPTYPPAMTKPRRYQPARSNGCGAVIHTQALPRWGCGVWTARTDAEDIVLPLDKTYFDDSTARQLVHSSCGCIREGIGCAECGNILGTRYKPCQAAADGIFAPPPSSSTAHLAPPPPAPTYIYTFFSANVSSSPAFDFAPRTAVQVHRHLHGDVPDPEYDFAPPAPAIMVMPPAPMLPTVHRSYLDITPGAAPERESDAPAYWHTYFVDRQLSSSPAPIPDEEEAVVPSGAPALEEDDEPSTPRAGPSNGGVLVRVSSQELDKALDR